VGINMSKVKEMTEVQARCDHPEEEISRMHFDIMEQPYRTCRKCGMDFVGRDMLDYLKELQRKVKNRD